MGELPREKNTLASAAIDRKQGRSTEASEGSGGLGGARPTADPALKLPNQAEGNSEKQEESLRCASDDAAQLRATVERLKNELDSIRAGNAGTGIGVGGGGLGSNGANSRFQFGAPAAPPWVAGGMRPAP